MQHVARRAHLAKFAADFRYGLIRVLISKAYSHQAGANFIAIQRAHGRRRAFGSDELNETKALVPSALAVGDELE